MPDRMHCFWLHLDMATQTGSTHGIIAATLGQCTSYRGLYTSCPWNNNLTHMQIYFGVHVCAAFNYEERLWNYQKWYPFATGVVAIALQSSGHYAKVVRPLALVGTPLWHGALTGFLYTKSLAYPIPSDDRLRKNLRLWTGCFAVATCMSISLTLIFSLVRDAKDNYYLYCLVSVLHS
jgi:hypothetical protein